MGNENTNIDAKHVIDTLIEISQGHIEAMMKMKGQLDNADRDHVDQQKALDTLQDASRETLTKLQSTSNESILTAVKELSDKIVDPAKNGYELLKNMQMAIQHKDALNETRIENTRKLIYYFMAFQVGALGFVTLILQFYGGPK